MGNAIKTKFLLQFNYVMREADATHKLNQLSPSLKAIRGSGREQQKPKTLRTFAYEEAEVRSAELTRVSRLCGNRSLRVTYTHNKVCKKNMIVFKVVKSRATPLGSLALPGL